MGESPEHSGTLSQYRFWSVLRPFPEVEQALNEEEKYAATFAERFFSDSGVLKLFPWLKHY